jgi:hypothetical protein
MFNHLRCLLGLDVYVIQGEEAKVYYSSLEKHDEEKLLSLL